MADFKICRITNKKGRSISFLYDIEDEYIVNKNKWHFSITTQGKIYIKNGKRKLLHRLLLQAKDNEIVDHINGNPLDNRRENLRITDSSKNNKNRKGYSKTGWKFFTFFDRIKHSRSYCVYVPNFPKKQFIDKKSAEAYYLECLMSLERSLRW
jgi:hypothetical protein